ncbi:MAG TPA: hypothetical protein PKY87_18925 [Terricaulis sp.]|nr:hypothetical protein [Terricaulis sp.]
MTKLDSVLARIRQLPPERQEAMAVQIEILLDDDEPGASLLSEAQWAEVERALADRNEAEIPHEKLFAAGQAKQP